jgi:3-deoxy-D-manno-octulosonic-acid transferase
MRRLYSFCIHVLAPLAFAVVLWRGIRNRGYWQGLGERFGFGPPARAPCIWLHAVSLGEVSAAAALVRALQARHPHTPVILTTATPTGRARALTLFGDSADVRFLPYDTPGSVRRFLRRIRPRLAIIMETELWPNLFSECARMGVPLVLANARLSAKSVSRYRRFGSLFRGVFSATTLVAAQTVEDAVRFSAIGARPDRTHVTGNVKFDQDVGPAALEEGRALRSRFFSGRPTWIAGSTHAGEEDQVLSAHAALRKNLPQVLLLLVPRHPARFDSVAELLEARKFPFQRRSLGQAVPAETPVMLVDTVGELGALYAAADVAFVGGSLVPVGGHNLLEPAALGVPVLTGPFNSNGQDILRLLVQQGAAVQVADAQELAVSLARLLEDVNQRRRAGEAGRRAVEANRGSVARLLELIEPLAAQAEARP